MFLYFLDWHSLHDEIFDMEYYKAKYKLKGNNWTVTTFGGIRCKKCGSKIEDRCKHNKERVKK